MADTARQTSEAFGDLEFEYNLKQLLDKDPIAALGFDPAKASYSVPQGDKYGTKYSREEDTLFYGPDTGSSKDILVHEFRHRGHQLLRNEIEKNPEAFAEKYGQDVVDFLTGEFSETEGKFYPGDRQEEFRTELSDNLEATYNKPRPSEEKLLQGIKDSLGDSANLFSDQELLNLAVKNYVKNVDNTGYIKDKTELVTKEDQEKYKNILSKVRQAASDILQQRKGYDQGGTVGKVLDFLTTPLTGDYRKKKPTSVQMAEVGVEFTPVGTVSGVLDIKEELESEDPDYTDVALMVGTELLGLTPVGETGSKLIGGVKSRFKDRNLQRAADLLRKELGNKNPRNEFRDLNEARRNKSAIPYDVNERIWNETGWYVDPLDGQWRYEIDDSQAKMFPKGFVNTQTKNNTRPVITYEEFKTDPYAKVTFKLGDILSHDELYKNYPKFKDADVELYSEADNNILGWFSQDLDRIGLNAARLDSNEQLKSTLLHEIQHMIQKKEGFSRGSNKSSDEVLARLGTEKENEFARYGNLKNKQQQLKAKLRSRINAPTPQVRNDLIDQIQDLEREIQSIENFLKDDNTLQYALYRGAGGEIEARLVQRRMNLTSGERAADQRTSDNYDFFVEGDSVGGFPLADRNIMIAEDSNLPNYAEGALDVARKIDDRREPGPLSFFGKLKRKYDDLFNKFAEGGTVAMNEQMSFAFADGGLRDDGMKEDPVSGNEVPPGSTAKEVRDDIPAQLSEGEYVVPADVVRYYGVKFFEDLRDAAKMGLQDMEARGRIGGEPVPAGGPMNEDDLTPEELAAIQEMMGMSEGGTVAGFAPGGLQTDQDILAAGQQAQQNQFTGFPLGATIFPRAESGEIEAVPTTPTITTEETAESCAAKDMDYDPATKTCVPRVVATTTPAPSDDDDGPRVEPPKWHEKYDYADTNKLVSQSLATLGVDSGTEEKETQNTLQKIAGSIGQGIGNMLEGGILGGIIRQQKVAEVAANAQLLRAQGRIKEAEMLEDAIDGYRDKHDIEPGGFFDSTKTLAKQLADKYSDLTYDEENETIIKPGSTTTKPPTPTSTPTSTPTTTPKPTKSPATAAKSLAKQASNADNSAQLAAIQKAQSIAQKAADAGTSIAEQTQTGSGGYGSSSQVEEETGGQGDQGLGSGWGGMNAGGLMAGKPKTKTKRQYKKGGLAGKK